MTYYLTAQDGTVYIARTEVGNGLTRVVLEPEHPEAPEAMSLEQESA